MSRNLSGLYVTNVKRRSHLFIHSRQSLRTKLWLFTCHMSTKLHQSHKEGLYSQFEAWREECKLILGELLKWKVEVDDIMD